MPYVIVSHLNQAIQIDPASKVTLIGTASNDSLQTSTSISILRGLAGNDVLTGLTTQIDFARFYGNSSDFSITRGSHQIIVKDNAGSEGIDTLKEVDRVIFSNSSFAFDIDGNAGVVAKILGAVFGKDAITNKNYVGIGLHFLDNGWTYDNLSALALDAAGAKSHDQIVNLLWTNVIGTKPTSADKAPYIALLENGMAAGALAHLAADSSFNTTNINLVGITQAGIEYTPIS